jgi:hypothetical protein
MLWAKNNASIAGTLAATNAATASNSLPIHHNRNTKPFNEPIIGNSIEIKKLVPSSNSNVNINNNNNTGSNNGTLNQIENNQSVVSNKAHYTTTYRASYQKP